MEEAGSDTPGNSGSAETYETWIPLPGIAARMNLAGLSHTDEGVRVLLQHQVGEGRVLTLLFESPVANRNINESYRLRTWNRLGEHERSSLLRVHHSDWVEWLRREAGGVLDAVTLHHYAIFTDEDCVELVTEFPPRVAVSDRSE
ncbi:MAG: hypothetical protein VYE22_39615 [Myxococcota bacterium]|nr:hypothetical protein [Myxococcota bacterium]